MVAKPLPDHIGHEIVATLDRLVRAFHLLEARITEVERRQAATADTVELIVNRYEFVHDWHTEVETDIRRRVADVTFLLPWEDRKVLQDADPETFPSPADTPIYERTP
jgi:hypothetical protein